LAIPSIALRFSIGTRQGSHSAMEPRAPRHFGAWVLGRFYRPGQFLPVGNGDMNIRDIVTIAPEFRRRGTTGFVTLSIVVPYGTSYEDIIEQFKELLEQYLEQASP
jgi:hypothetical protein